MANVRKAVIDAIGEAGAGNCDNIGLMMDRYYAGDPAENQSKPNRAKLLEKIVGVPYGGNGSGPYRSAFNEYRSLLAQNGWETFQIESVGPFVTGIAIPSPFELNLRLDHTHGTPVIDGSTLKGAFRDAAADLLGLDRKKDINPSLSPSEIEKIHGADGLELVRTFGSIEQISNILVADAWMEPGQKPFFLDILTPHAPSYQKSKGVLPLETENPEPHPYLVVRPGIKFLFAIRLPNPEWIEPIRSLVQYCLSEKGIGAKTNQGYGRFRILGASGTQNSVNSGQESGNFMGLKDMPGKVQYVTRQSVSILIEGQEKTLEWRRQGTGLQKGDALVVTVGFRNGVIQSIQSAKKSTN